jgi:hypothetical protein
VTRRSSEFGRPPKSDLPGERTSIISLLRVQQKTIVT